MGKTHTHAHTNTHKHTPCHHSVHSSAQATLCVRKGFFSVFRCASFWHISRRFTVRLARLKTKNLSSVGFNDVGLYTLSLCWPLFFQSMRQIFYECGYKNSQMLQRIQCFVDLLGSSDGCSPVAAAPSVLCSDPCWTFSDLPENTGRPVFFMQCI